MNRSLLTNPYLLILPGLFLAGFIIIWPLVQITEIAGSEVNRFGQLRGFAGLANFRAVFTDPAFLYDERDRYGGGCTSPVMGVFQGLHLFFCSVWID